MDVELLEKFFLDNLKKFDVSDALCRIFKENANSELPLILAFTSSFYLAIIQHNYLSNESGMIKRMIEID